MSAARNSNGAGAEPIPVDLKIEDPECKICMEIYLEPVTFPCHHSICMPCFRQHITKTSLQCPFCRVRIGTWVRRNTKNLVNQQFWSRLQAQFPQQIQARQNGESLAFDADSFDFGNTTGDLSQVPPTSFDRQLVEPGAIGEDFKKQMQIHIMKFAQEEEEATAKSLKFIHEQFESEVKRQNDLILMKSLSASGIQVKKVQEPKPEPGDDYEEIPSFQGISEFENVDPYAELNRYAKMFEMEEKFNAGEQVEDPNESLSVKAFIKDSALEDQQKALLDRIRQEQADAKLARKLQKELNSNIDPTRVYSRRERKITEKVRVEKQSRKRKIVEVQTQSNSNDSMINPSKKIKKEKIETLTSATATQQSSGEEKNPTPSIPAFLGPVMDFIL